MKPEHDLPRINLSQIEKRRDRLVAKISEYAGKQLTGDEFNEFCRTMHRALPAGIPKSAVVESLRIYAGSALTTTDLVKLSWRLAAHISTLKAGKAVRQWKSPRKDEWVPAQIFRLWPGKDYFNRLGHYGSLRILAGTPTAMEVSVFWNRKVLGMIAHRIGFSGYRGKYRYEDPVELVGLRLFVCINASKSRTAPEVFGVDCTDTLIEWNRKHVLRLRKRIELCPRGWRHPCHRCGVGYLECPGGTHQYDYTADFCSVCGKADQVFDPEMGNQACRNCLIKARFRN